MSPDKLKFYIELMKSLTAFTIGTGAAVLTFATLDSKYEYFLVFSILLCTFSLGTFVALFVYIERNLD